MKRRYTPRGFQPEPGESWSQWIGRLLAKEITDARRRYARQKRLWRWPGAARVKAEYHRRHR